MYATGPVTLAAEYNYLTNWGAQGNKGYGYILMGNLAVSDKAAAHGPLQRHRHGQRGQVHGNHL